MLEEVLTAAFLRAGKEKLLARGEAAGALTPVLDEDVSNHLLRPVVRSVISRLDKLLVGLHHERSYTKALVAEEAAARARAPPRPRKRRQARRGEAVSSSAKAARERHRAVTPMTDTEDEEEAEAEAEPVRKRKRAPSPVAQQWARKRMMRLRLRDWSNVVGVAALTGFEGGVVQRTAGRCGALFGETMGWRCVGRDDHLRDRRGGEEWVGARVEAEGGSGSGSGSGGGKEEGEGSGSKELYEGITRDGFLAPVARPVRKDVGRRRPKYV